MLLTIIMTLTVSFSFIGLMFHICKYIIDLRGHIMNHIGLVALKAQIIYENYCPVYSTAIV